MVTGYRTGVETSQTDAVLDGDLDRFIDGELRRRAAGRATAGKKQQ